MRKIGMKARRVMTRASMMGTRTRIGKYLYCKKEERRMGCVTPSGLLGLHQNVDPFAELKLKSLET
jgi:hypothetical protein